jgi:hypothetical protein
LRSGSAASRWSGGCFLTRRSGIDRRKSAVKVQTEHRSGDERRQTIRRKPDREGGNTLAPRYERHHSTAAAMSTFLGIVIAAVSVFTFAGVVWLFIWAAKKDGEEDRAIQKRLGIRRRTRLGR